jgi:hypothetical protein
VACLDDGSIDLIKVDPPFKAGHRLRTLRDPNRSDAAGPRQPQARRRRLSCATVCHLCAFGVDFV